MGLRVNTNIPVLRAQRNLAKSTGALNKALARLASGSRIISAGDDAAGLAVSEGLRSQVRGLRQSIRNANDATGFLATAEGALQEMTNIAQRLRELSIQAANGTIGSRDRQFLDNERSALVEEFNRIANSTSYNTTKLLDGTFSTVELQVGVLKGDKISFTIGDARSTALGALASVSGGHNNLTSNFAGIQINGSSITVDSADDSISAAGSEFSAITVARAINEATGSTDVTATNLGTKVLINDIDFTDLDALERTLGADDFTINGFDIVGQFDQTAGGFIELINEFSTSTGVTASLQSGSSDDIQLFASDGRNIILGMASHVTSTGNTIAMTASLNAAFAATTNVRDTSNNNRMLAADNTITAGVGLATSSTANYFTGSVEIFSSSAIILGGTSTSNFFGATGSTVAVDTSSALFAVDISSQSGAQNALATIDTVLQQLISLRADLGAVQNRLDAVVNSLSITSENLDSAKSLLADADMAVESAELTKNQVLQQAGVAVLAQANVSNQIAIQLLNA